MSSPSPDLSISIVSLNRADLVRQCLATIVKFTVSITYEIHVVAHNYDPDSLADLAQSYPSVLIHRMSGIRGYSQNNNVALKAARGRYAVILNDDTILDDDLFGQMVAFLDAHTDVVGACPVLRYPDGSLQMGVRGRLTPASFLAEQLRLDRFVPMRWAIWLGAFDRPWLPRDDGRPIDIEVGTGACFMARWSALQAIGFLDEAYFLAPDDIDWSVRLGRVGRLVLLPTLSLTHLASATLSRSYHAVVPTVYAGYYTFFRRHYGQISEWLVRIAAGFLWSFLLSAAWALLCLVRNSPRPCVMRRARWNCVRFAFSQASSSEVFARLVSPN
jgi:GT2 family glycosyltransferase